MKKLNKLFTVAGVTAAVAVAGVTGLGVASAQTSTNSTGSKNSLVQAIADKFKLNKTEVQAVFDANRADMAKQRETDTASKQAQLVKDGKITQAQSDLITAKRAELQKARTASKTTAQSSTATDRKAQMEKDKTALDAWLKEKGIDAQYAYLLMGGGRGHGMAGGKGGMNGSKTTSSSSSTTSTTTSN